MGPQGARSPLLCSRVFASPPLASGRDGIRVTVERCKLRSILFCSFFERESIERVFAVCNLRALGRRFLRISLLLSVRVVSCPSTVYAVFGSHVNNALVNV